MIFNIAVLITIVASVYFSFKAGFKDGYSAHREHMLNYIAKHSEGDLVRVRLEKIDLVYTVYEHETSKYLTSGKDLEEINDKLINLKTNKTYWIHPEDIKKHGL